VFLSLPLLLGLLVVAVHRELLPALPGSAAVGVGPGPWLPLLFAPMALATAAAAGARRTLLSGRAPLAPPRALLRLSFAAVPLAAHALFAFGAYGDFVDDLTQGGPFFGIVLTALPVFVAEALRAPAAVRAAALCDVVDELRAEPTAIAVLPGAAGIAGLARLRLGGVAFVAMPVLVLAAGMELLAADRSLRVFALATTPGTTLGALALLLAVVAILPWWFRRALAVRPLPPAAAAPLGAVAEALGFPPHRVELLPTGMRALNAMLVGPLPFGRCLCLTDGIVRELDVDALAGVVAHEIGHARCGHPTLLMTLAVVTPLLLLAPLRWAGIEALDPALQAVVVAVGATVAWLALRALAHRFEHEADVASVAALGAGPCSRALLTVARLAPMATHGLLTRLTSLHPDEQDRWRTMRRYEEDPGFRASFDRQSRRIRVAVAAVAALAALAFVGASARDWPHEQVVWRLHAGDHAAALRLAAALGPPPPHWREVWPLVEQDLAVVRALAPAAADWPTARAALWPAAWQRGEDVLLAQGPAAARPWLSLALGAADHATPLQRALLGWSEAAADGDPERMAAIGEVVRALGVPPRLERAFGG
jgi:Zn-dependent protease with chaperone function